MNVRAFLATTTAVIIASTLMISASPSNAVVPAKQKIPDVIVGSATAPEAGHISVRGIDVEIGVTPPAGVIKAEGRKPNSFLPLMGRSGPIGKVMTFTFNVGKGKCSHEYGFPMNGGSVVEFTSTCKNTKSFNGAKVGMNVLKAETVTGAIFGKPGYIGTDYICLLDNTNLTFHSNGAYIVVWSKVAASNEGKSAYIESISAYSDPAALLFQSGICDPL